jgi:L-Ala-D/L-Glu epimerase
MKIHDLELFLVAMTQGGSPAPTRSLLVRLATASGLEGWGEAAVEWRTGELGPRREALLAALAGRSVFDIEELHTLDALSHAPLRSAVEMAAWDLLGRVLRQPLCNLLGGYYRRRAPASVRLTGCHPKTAAPVARELAEQGFHTQTIVSGGRPDEDAKTLAAVRETVGDRIELRFDGQGRFDLETARDLCADLEFEKLQCFFDPLAAPDLHALAALGRQTNVPLAAWRAIRSPADLWTAARCNAAPLVVVDLEQVGGIAPARACAAVAAAAGLKPLLGVRASLGIATAAMLHLAAATPAFSISSEIDAGAFRDSVLVDSFEVVDGMTPVPEGHGLGIEVDRTKVERHQPTG